MALIFLQQEDGLPTCGFAACSPRSNTGGTSQRRSAAIGGTAGVTSPTVTLNNNETRVNAVMFGSGQIGVTAWGSGNYVVRLNITDGDNDLTWEDTYVCRVNNVCTNQETLGSLTSQAISLASTGVQSMTISGSSTTALATDRLSFILAFSNASAHGPAESFDFLPNQLIDTPIDDGVIPEAMTAVLAEMQARNGIRRRGRM